MSNVIVDLALAIVCASDWCAPILAGDRTPVGAYTLQHYATDTAGYGGDVLAFSFNGNEVFAIHRVLPSAQGHRAARLQVTRTTMRSAVTGGCINVAPDVYELLVDCCSNSSLEIRR